MSKRCNFATRNLDWFHQPRLDPNLKVKHVMYTIHYDHIATSAVVALGVQLLLCRVTTQKMP